MQRFAVAVGFKPGIKIDVRLEGEEIDALDLWKLQRAFAEGASAILSPSYLSWLASKGGPCAALSPDLLPHKPKLDGSACALCGSAVAVAVAVAAAPPEAAASEAASEAAAPAKKSKKAPVE